MIQAGESGLRLYYLMYKTNLPGGGLHYSNSEQSDPGRVEIETCLEFTGWVKNDRVFIWGPDRSWYFDPIATLDQTEELAAWFTKISEPK